ncbi:lysophosphatidylcholine acyltransferase 2-like isoform X3 [Pomacea canaliculata]|uniref:lysophosphatidylcholine acyltransferase 2-like isoform X3 n=1 Tax=Pomacea canaliculata TaxID=400727 RepID=UPI000D72D886|nr:lysophosphatidylcholine acyltransferase 2-like isoform X3 [Pomacea canaliculata]
MKRNIEPPRLTSITSPVVLNPFVHRLHLSILDIIQIAIMSVTIAPLRLLMVGLLLLAVWPLAAIAIAFRSPEDRSKPLSGWRRSYGRLLRFVLRMIVFIFGFRVKVKGKKARPDEVTLMCVAPHSSFFDGMVYVIGGDDLPSMVSREENVTIPLLGRIIEFSQPVLVRREDPNSRLSTIKEIQRRSQSGGQWPQIFIFPEGTCTNRSCLITFKGGAFIPGVPVQPVCLRYGNKLDTITWTWDGPGAYQCLWFTLCQFQNHLEIEFLPVYKPNQQEIENPRLFAENVRAVMAECLQIPVTDHTYDDCRLMRRAEALHLPMQAGIVEFQKLKKKLGWNFEDMQRRLDQFRSMDVRKAGNITLSEFAAYLHLPVSSAVEELFALYDRDGSGSIDFREYLIGLSLVSQPANTENTLRFAFELFDEEKTGYIHKQSFKRILQSAFQITDEDTDALFQMADADKNSLISFDEFKNCAQERPEYAKLLTSCYELSTSNGHKTENGKNGFDPAEGCEGACQTRWKQLVK